MDFDYAIHKLWIDYLVWIRDYIYVLMLRRDGMQYIEDRLTRLTTEVSSFFAPYYGDQVAKQFGDLLNRHVDLIAQYAAIVHANESPEPLREALYANQDDLANLLAAINPNWDASVWQGLYQNQTYLEEALIWSLHRNGYGDAIAQYDDIYANIDSIINYLIDGFVKQFGPAVPQGTAG